MDLIGTKILVAVLFGVLRFFFGVIPIKIFNKLKKWEGGNKVDLINNKRHDQVTCFIALCQSFGGGVLFATCFLHMIPEAYFSIEDLKKFGDLDTRYPISQLIISCGFFIIYFLEEISHWFITNIPVIKCPSSVPSEERIFTSSNKITPLKQSSKNGVFIITSGKIQNYEKEAENEKKLIENDDTDDNLSVGSSVRRENEKNLALDQVPDSEMIEETKELERIFNSSVKSQQQILRCILIELALSLHAIFEGLAIGLQTSIGNIWYLFTAVSIHSATILFCIGLEMLLAKTKEKIIIYHFMVLSTASPIGVLVGLLITVKADMNTRAKSIAVVLLEGISAGTILYITFFEVLNREKERRVYRFTRALFILAGFTLMAALQCLEIGS